LSGDAPTDTAALVYLFASEYGWSAEYSLGLPVDVVNELTHAILYRRGVHVVRRAGGAQTGSLQGRMDAILDTAATEETWHAQD
jgi:hypothetical protein